MHRKTIYIIIFVLGVVSLIPACVYLGFNASQGVASKQIEELNEQRHLFERAAFNSGRERVKLNETVKHLKSEQCAFGKSYHNLSVGISVDFPIDSWCLPPEDSKAPRFYSTEYCKRHYTNSCEAIAINPGFPDIHKLSPETRFENLKGKDLNPVLMDDFIPEAIVIKHKMDGQDWVYQYDVFVEGNGPRYIINTNKITTEKILKSFRPCGYEACASPRDIGAAR